MHVVLEQELGVAFLDAPALCDVGQVVDRAVQRQAQWGEHVFATPCRGDRPGGQVGRSLGAHLALKEADCGELGAEVRERLAQTRLGQLADVDGAEAMVQVVEAVAVFADVQGDEPERVPGVSDPPVRVVRWILAHSWKLASWRAARFVTLAKTIRKRKKGILAAVKLGINNARHEGLNRRVLIVVNRGYGFHFASAVLALIMLMLGPINHVLPHERQPAVDPSINPHSCREGRHSLRDAGTSRTEEMTTSAAA